MNYELSDAKNEHRAQARALRAAHAHDAPVSFVPLIRELPAFVGARTVALYMSMRGEPDTADLIALCHALGKRVVIPAWNADTKTYGFALLAPDAVLTRGPMNIPEPAEKHIVPISECDLVFVPGLMFDAHNTRLGHGAGYYDRLLADRPATCTVIGLAFAWQLTAETLPRDAFDVPMDILVSG